MVFGGRLRGFACGIYPFSGPEILRDIIDSMQSASGLRDSFEAVGQYLQQCRRLDGCEGRTLGALQQEAF